LFLGNSTVTGSSGTIGNEFLNISAGAVGSTVNFNGPVFSTTTNVSGTGTLNFNGNVRTAANFDADGFINLGANQSFTGAITTNTANTGTLTLNGGSSVTGAIGGANGLKQINVVGGNAAITGAVQTQGFSLGTNTLAINGVLTTNAGGTIATTLASNSSFGNIKADTSLINAGGITVNPTVTGVLTNGTNFRIVDAPAGTIGALVNVINNSPLYKFSGTPTSTGDVNIRVGLVSFDSPSANAGGALFNVDAPVGSDLFAVQSAIAVLPTTAAVSNALAQLASGATNLAAPRVAVQNTQHFEDLLMARVDEIDNCEPNNPRAQENAQKCKSTEKRSNWWGNGYGNWGRQGDIDNMNGYKSETAGLMLAYDIPLNIQTRVGLGFGYANTTIDGNNSSGHTNFDSYLVTGYLSHTPGPWFAKGALTIGTDRYNGSRPIVFPGVDREASADFSGQQYTGSVRAGRHFFLNQATTVTPFALLRASHVNVDSYTERGAGDVNLLVSSQSYNFAQSGLGVKAERNIQSSNGTYTPEVHFKWLHNFGSTTMQQNAAFTGGGTEFAVQGINQDRELYNIGFGVTFLSCNCDENSWAVRGLYDYKWNQSNYSSNQVSVVASMKF